MQVEAIDEFKDQTVVCYCRSGQRSMQACLMLETMGFSDVRNLTGGMLEWEANYK
jgi:rhodanese-related sulfurtransferase